MQNDVNVATEAQSSFLSLELTGVALKVCNIFVLFFIQRTSLSLVFLFPDQPPEGTVVHKPRATATLKKSLDVNRRIQKRCLL